jgi:shikimate kinase
MNNIQNIIFDKPIFLIGMMGSWKSTIGRLLADRLNLQFIDTDREIEIGMKMKIGNIFKLMGEVRFREEENNTLNRLTNKNNIVVATGGGIVTLKQNCDILKSGICIMLRANATTLSKRINSIHARPLLNNETDLETQLKEILNTRKVSYESTAHIIVDTDELEPIQIIDLIIEKLKDIDVNHSR